MKLVVKTMVITLLVSLLAGPLAVWAAEFPDLPGDYWARREILEMQNLGILAGAKDGNFYPESDVTRAEFAAMLSKSLKLPVQAVVKSRFNDVPKGHWAFGYIEAAAGAGFINGYQGKFRPGDNISRQEMAVIVMKVSSKYGYVVSGTTDILVKYKDKNDIASWAAASFAEALKYGYIREAGYRGEIVTGSAYSVPWNKRELKPAANATRAESAFALYRMLIRTGLI